MELVPILLRKIHAQASPVAMSGSLWRVALALVLGALTQPRSPASSPYPF